MRRFFSRTKRPRAGLPRLSISAEGPTPSEPMRVALDGHDITNGLTQFTLSCGVGDVHKVALELYAGSLEVDTPALPEVVANPAMAAKDEWPWPPRPR